MSFDFNGRTIKVRPDTNIDLVMRDFWRPLSITGDTIGPYPDPASLEIDERFAMERGSNPCLHHLTPRSRVEPAPCERVKLV